MARKLQVEIVGDASSLHRALGQASNSGSRFGNSMKAAGKAAGIGLAAGVTLGVIALKKSFDAAIDAEKAQTRLETAFKAAGASAEQRAVAMKAVNDVSRRSALDDEDLMDTLGKLTRVTGNVTDAQKSMAVAANIARARGIELEAATNIVSKAHLGNLGALKRIGIEIPKVTSAQDALKASGAKVTAEQLKQAKATDELSTRQTAIASLQKQYAGASETYGKTAAGAQDRFRVAVENLQESLGQKLLPVFSRLMEWVNSNMPAIEAAVGGAFDAIGTAVMSLAPLVDRVKTAFFDLVNTVKGLAPALQSIASFSLDAVMSSWGTSLFGANIAMGVFYASITKVIAAFKAMQAAATGATFAAMVTPLGLATAAVGALAFAFLKTRGDVSAAQSALDSQRASVVSLADAVKALTQAQDAQRSASLSVKESHLAVERALVTRNRLESEGKTGSLEYREAQLAVQRAFLSRTEAEHRAKQATEDNTKAATGAADAMVKLRADTQAVGDKSRETATSVKNMLGGEGQRAVVLKYAGAMDDAAKKADKIAASAKGVNPQIRAAATAFAAQARAAADVARKTNEIPPAFEAVVGPAGSAGSRIGKSLGAGIQSGINSYIGPITTAAANLVRQAEQAARSAAQAKSPSQLMARVGEDMGQGVIVGLQSKIPATKMTAVQVAQAAIDSVKSKQQAFKDAWQAYSDAALAVFDDLTSKIKTASEKALAAFDKKQLVKGINDAIKDAKKAVADAELGVKMSGAFTPPTFEADPAKSAAENAAAQTAAQTAALDEWAKNNAAAQEKLKSAQDQLDAALLAKQRYGLEQRATAERTALDKKIANDRQRLEDDLASMTVRQQRMILKEGQGQQAILDKIKSYNPAYRAHGEALGAAIARGLRDAAGGVTDAANELAAAIAKALGVASNIGKKAADDAGEKTRVAGGRAAGGGVQSGRAYVVGERGPELFRPGTSGMVIPNGGWGGGATVVNNYISGSVVTERQLADTVRTELMRIGRYNAGGVFGGVA